MANYHLDVTSKDKRDVKRIRKNPARFMKLITTQK